MFPESYLDRVASRLTCDRDLRLAQFAGGGLRRLGIRPATLTDTNADTYPDTVLWAEAAWAHTECDGIIWMTRHWNTSRALVLFGDRVSSLHQDPSYARAFANPPDIEWLAALCAQVNVSFVPPSQPPYFGDVVQAVCVLPAEKRKQAGRRPEFDSAPAGTAVAAGGCEMARIRPLSHLTGAGSAWSPGYPE